MRHISTLRVFRAPTSFRHKIELLYFKHVHRAASYTYNLRTAVRVYRSYHGTDLSYVSVAHSTLKELAFYIVSKHVQQGFLI